MNQRVSAIVLLALVMVIWGSSYAVTKASLVKVSPMLLAFLRNFIASILLTAQFLNLLPVIGVAGGVLFLGERVLIQQIFGGALVLSGVWLSLQARAHRSESADS